MKSLKAYTIHEKYRAALLGLANDLRQYNFLCQEEEDLRRIADNLRAPFNIAVFGRMKAGKSSLINAIIGQKLTITDTEEATATINRLSYATGDRLKTFTIHWQHCQPEDRPLSELETEWSGKASKVLENVGRAAWLELYSDAEALRNIHITDTPGTGSTAYEHERVAQQFIKGQVADALIYVFRPDVHEDDLKSLTHFCTKSGNATEISNTIGVLHHWDTIYYDPQKSMQDVNRLAAQLATQTQEYISTIIPVSAPLGLLAKTAPDAFWVMSRTILATIGSEAELRDLLMMDEIWNEDPLRHAVYEKAHELGCPWVSFCAAMLHLFRYPQSDAAELILNLSGMPLLEKTLDTQIFSNRVIIQHSQNTERFTRTMAEAQHKIHERINKQENDLRRMERVRTFIPGKETELKNWQEERYSQLMADNAALINYNVNLDRRRLEVVEWSECIIQAQELIPWLLSSTDLPITEEMKHKAIAILLSLLPNGQPAQGIERKDIARLSGLAGSFSILPNATHQKYGENLQRCIMNWANQQVWSNVLTNAREVMLWVNEHITLEPQAYITLMSILTSVMDDNCEDSRITKTEFNELQFHLDKIYRKADQTEPEITKKLQKCLKKWSDDQKSPL